MPSITTRLPFNITFSSPQTLISQTNKTKTPLMHFINYYHTPNSQTPFINPFNNYFSLLFNFRHSISSLIHLPLLSSYTRDPSLLLLLLLLLPPHLYLPFFVSLASSNMAAEVSRQIKSEAKSGCPITRDFLGGCLAIESKELDLDLQVPAGWEKRLDLKSGKVYIQRCSQPTSQTQPSSFSIPPSKPKTTPLSLFDDTALDLKLSPSKSLGNYNNANYQSVCTLDKVKSALDRAWRVSSPTSRKRPSPSNSASSSMATDDSNSNSHVWSSKDRSAGGGKMVAGACPDCLLYVLISENNPKCPKCNCVIALRDVPKKPKFDLNMSF